MILQNSLWPLFAAASYFRGSPEQNPVTMNARPQVMRKGLFPGHTLIELNDVGRITLNRERETEQDVCLGQHHSLSRLGNWNVGHHLCHTGYVANVWISGSVRGTNGTADVLRALNNGWRCVAWITRGCHGRKMLIDINRHIDTSLNYGNQVGTGIAIQRSGIPRDQLYITSKYDAVDGIDVAHEIHTTLDQVRTFPAMS